MNLNRVPDTTGGASGRSRLGAVVCLPLLAWRLVAPAHGDTILNTKHDLSVGGAGPIKAVSETEVCLFCHTPHKATSQTPLWNRALSTATYIPYDSSTIKATIGQPTGSSKLCLSCHDGTVALGMVNTRSTPIQMRNNLTTLPPGRTRIGTDLSDDHPVSFTYDHALASIRGQLKPPSTLTTKVRLDHNQQMQCTACHDPHDNQYGKFLVQDNYASALCLQCHEVMHWENSAHRLSTRTWNGAGLDPWPNTGRNTVAANACENCHTMHSAGTRPRLLTFALEEQNCLSCHNGNVATKNLQPEFNKFSAHPVLNATGLHDPMEDPLNAPRHATCVDCHNPHASRTLAASAPFASGALAGVKGITVAGAVVNPLSRESELCYRCHGDSHNRKMAYVPRQIVQTNTRLEFNPANASFHPVESVGKNPSVPSLLFPWTTASLMYCTDCHNNDQGPNAGGSGPNGPHGSIYAPLLERQLQLNDFETENSGAYALCYKCHSRSSILADQSFKKHKRHIVNAQTACTTCHDPHGVANQTHLINFNTRYVTPNSKGQLLWMDRGHFSGACSLKCHGKEHDNLGY